MVVGLRHPYKCECLTIGFASSGQSSCRSKKSEARETSSTGRKASAEMCFMNSAKQPSSAS